MYKKNIAKVLQQERFKGVSLEERLEIISLEFNPVTSAYHGISNAIKNIGSFFSNIKSRISSFLFDFKIEQRKDLVASRNLIPNIIKNVNLQNVGSIQAPVTLGLKVNLIVVNDLLKLHSKDVSENLIGLLTEAEQTLSNILGDENFRNSFKPRTGGFKTYRDIDRDMEESINKIIDANGTSDRRDIKDLIPNMNSLKVLTDETLALEQAYDPYNLRKTDGMIDSIHEMIERLVSLMEAKRITMSKEALSAVSLILDISADYTTTATSMYYLYVQQLMMVNSLIKLLDKVS